MTEIERMGNFGFISSVKQLFSENHNTWIMQAPPVFLSFLNTSEFLLYTRCVTFSTEGSELPSLKSNKL